MRALRWAILVLSGWILLPSLAWSAGSRSYLELGGRYLTGDFGTPTTSRLVALEATLGHVAPRYDGSITIPYLNLTNETGGVSDTENGLGDIIVRGGSVLLPENAAGLSVYASAAVKLPTAEESKGLGTGEADFGVYAAVDQRLQAYKLTVNTGYLLTGDPEGREYNDGFSFGCGLSRSFARTTVYTTYEQYPAVVDGFDRPQELSLGFFHIFSLDYAVRGRVVFGLNDGGPALGAGFGVVRWF